MAAPPDQEKPQATVERDAATISDGIINAVDTVAAIGSLFNTRGVVEPTRTATQAATAASQNASAAEESGGVVALEVEEMKLMTALVRAKSPRSGRAETAQLMKAVEEAAAVGVRSKAMEEARELLGIGDEAEGLSMEEMMEIARAQLGDAEQDEESDAALRAAFEALRETDTTQPEAPGGDKLKSSVLRGAVGFGFELRSFLEGAKRDLEGKRDQVVDKVKLDATLAARAADWLLRRAILDSGRVLGAASAALQLGAGAEPAPAEEVAAKEAEEVAPFASRLSSLDDAEERRNSGRLLLGAATETAEERAAEVAAAEAARREEGGEALKQTTERLRGAAELLQGKLEASEDLQKLGKLMPVELEASEGAVRAAGELGVLLERSRRDFESFDALASRGQLPTLGEEVRGQLPDWVTKPLSERQARGLGAFANQDVPAEQKRQRQQRKQMEIEARRLKLAASIAGRASKDSSDAVVFGVLPAARATAKVASRLAVQEYGVRVRSGDLPALPGITPAAASAEQPYVRPGAGSLLAEVTAELVQEYGEGLRAGVESGVLPDVQGRLGKVADGATRKLGGLQGKLQGALPGGLQSRLQGGPPSALPASPMRSAEEQAPAPASASAPVSAPAPAPASPSPSASPSASDAAAPDVALQGVAAPAQRKPWGSKRAAKRAAKRAKR